MGIIFKAPGFLIWVVAGLWGLAISLQIVHDFGGFLLAIVAFFVLPVLLTLAPLYAGFIQGDWFPLALVYGGGILGLALFAIGSAIDGE